MLDFLIDFLINSLPSRIQIGCLVVVVVLLIGLIAWAYWPEAA